MQSICFERKKNRAHIYRARNLKTIEFFIAIAYGIQVKTSYLFNHFTNNAIESRFFHLLKFKSPLVILIWVQFTTTLKTHPQKNSSMASFFVNRFLFSFIVSGVVFDNSLICIQLYSLNLRRHVNKRKTINKRHDYIKFQLCHIEYSKLKWTQ